MTAMMITSTSLSRQIQIVPNECLMNYTATENSVMLSSARDKIDMSGSALWAISYSLSPFKN